MGFISLLAALLFEQWQPLSPANRAYGLLGRYADFVAGKFNRGGERDGRNAWLLIVLPVVIGLGLLSVLLARGGSLYLLAWYIGTLYLALGFRCYGNFYSGIMTALQANDLPRAQLLLAAWRNQPADDLNSEDLAQEAVGLALLYSHRHVFGVIAWFVALGPAGALGYRIAALLAGSSGERGDASGATKTLDAYAIHAFHYIDYIPARLTALVFAVVGDFMGAVKRWRLAAASYRRGQDVILAIGAGALGGITLDESDPSPGKGAFDYMQVASGLMWRALVLWLFVIMLATAVSRL